MTSWVDKKDGWLKDYSKRKPRQVIVEEKKTEIINKGIFFMRPKCPKCGSKKVRCYGADGHIKYFKCKCGEKFRAIEQE